jgi:hypothetical protein
MSHLIESYSLQTGARIGKPSIIKNFFPTPEKYITIHNSSGMGAKNYDYFQEVVDEILPELEKNNIKIVQIGTADNPPLQGCIHIHGQTTYHQTAYVIDNSMLHIGNDSFPVHLASASDIPIVALYSITLPEIAGPFFNHKSKNKVFCFTPEYGDNKPSFNPNESPKTVNTINIEKIVNAIFSILGIENKNNLETIFIGESFKKNHVEFVPDGVINYNIFNNVPIVMRIDLLDNDFDENIIFANLKNGKFFIHACESKKIENIDAIKILKNNIAEYIIDVTKEVIDKKYINKIVNVGIKPIILYRGDDTEYFNEIKMNLIDLNLKFLYKKTNDKEIDKILKKIDNCENLWIKSSKNVLANGKIFLTEEHMNKNLPAESKKQIVPKSLDIKALLKEKDNLFIFKYNN